MTLFQALSDRKTLIIVKEEKTGICVAAFEVTSPTYDDTGKVITYGELFLTHHTVQVTNSNFIPAESIEEVSRAIYEAYRIAKGYIKIIPKPETY
jgi:hypothetical protein